MRTRLPFSRAVLFLIFFLVAEFLSGVLVNPITAALNNHKKLSWTCAIIAVLALVAYEWWRNKTADGSSSVYPAVQKKKDAEERLRTVDERIKELSDQTGEATIRNPRQWPSRWKLKRLEKERKNLTRKILEHDEHLRDFGGVAAYKLQELLAVAGWDVVPGIMDRLNRKAQFKVEETGDFQKRRRLLVHYLPREAGSKDIKELEQAISAQQVDHGWLIAEKLYAGSKIEPDSHIRFFRPEDLYFSELFNLGPYFEWLQRESNALNVSKRNVVMEGNIPTYDFEGNEVNRVHVESVDEKITEWQDSAGLNNILLLGDFGTGKTWFCWQYAHKMLEEFRKRPQLNRIPILIQLGEFKDSLKQKEPGAFGKPEQLIRIFCDKHRIDLKNFELFDTLNKQGHFLLILDGLDEIVSDQSELADTCRNLSQFAGGKSKVLLTSRHTLFRTTEERQALFGLHNFFEVIELKEFDTDKIQDFIKSHAPKRWRAYWQKISGIGNLMDLASRPIMLKTILDAFKLNLKLDENSTIVDLYRGYTDFWLEKVTRNTPRPDEPHSRRLIQLLAWRMFEKNCRPVDELDDVDRIPELSEIHYSELRGLVRDSSALTQHADATKNVNKTELEILAKDLTEAEVQTSDSEQEVLTRSFLLRNDATGNYFFAHRSFLEYFVAQKLFSDMREGHKEGFERCFLSPEIVDFLVCLKPNPTTILSWIEESRGDKSHLHGNLLTLLNKTGTNLRGQNFSRLYLKDADLGGADLENCDFTASTLIRVNVRDCRLTNTDFTDASFKNLMLGVRSPAKGVAFSPKGKFIASGGGNNAVVLLRKDGEKWVSKERLGHGDSITNVAFSSGDRFLASSSFDQTAIVWKLNGEKYCSLPRHKATVYDVEFTADGNYLFTASKEEIKLWRIIDDRESKELIASELSTFTAHSAEVYKLAASANGKYLASASFDHTLSIWKIKESPNGISLELRGRCEGHQSLVNGVSFSPDARFVASASNDGTIRIWSTDDLREVKVYQQHAGIVWDVTYSNSGRYLASGTLDKVVKVWDLRTEEIVTLEGHSKNIWSVCFSPDDELVVSGSLDSTVKIWDWKNNKCLQTLDMGLSVQQTFNCTGMKFTRNSGLSPFQEIFLTEFGASMLSDKSTDSRG